MNDEDLLSLVLSARSFRTRQHLWHECIEQIRENDLALEFGVWRGGSINYMANARPANEFHGFDSFEGLPNDWIKGRPAGHFKTDRQSLRFAPNIVIHQGLFSLTLPWWIEREHQRLDRLKFIHIDCDIGCSTDEVLELLGPTLIANRAHLLFDEFYNYQEYRQHEFGSFLKFVQRTGATFEVLGRNINHQQVLIRL
jgi:hypothetical protein